MKYTGTSTRASCHVYCIKHEDFSCYITTTPYLPCNNKNINRKELYDFYYTAITLTTGYVCGTRLISENYTLEIYPLYGILDQWTHLGGSLQRSVVRWELTVPLKHLLPGGRGEDKTMCSYQLRDGWGRGGGGSRGRHGLSVVQPHNLKGRGDGPFMYVCYAKSKDTIEEKLYWWWG